MNDDDIISKMIVLHSTFTLPSDLVIRIYESKADITVKETCFGLIIEGKRSIVDEVARCGLLTPTGYLLRKGVCRLAIRTGAGSGGEVDPNPGSISTSLNFRFCHISHQHLKRSREGRARERK